MGLCLCVSPDSPVSHMKLSIFYDDYCTKINYLGAQKTNKLIIINCVKPKTGLEMAVSISSTTKNNHIKRAIIGLDEQKVFSNNVLIDW